MSRRIRYRVTRAGLLFTIAISIVAFAAVVSANNLLFLVLAAMMATLLVSGLVSRLCLAGPARGRLEGGLGPTPARGASVRGGVPRAVNGREAVRVVVQHERRAVHRLTSRLCDHVKLDHLTDFHAVR